MLDFSLRVGFELKLCQPYRPQTKGKVESGVKYVRGNLWPSLRFTDDADLNRQTLEWCDQVANAREHGTTHRVPWEMLTEEHPHLGKLPDESGLVPYLREDRTVARDGYVSFEGSRYGVHWQWAGSTVQVGVRTGTVEIWAGDRRIAMHPRAQSPGQRFTIPGQWEGLSTGGERPANVPWRCRWRRAPWNAGPWRCTNWQREVCDDHDCPGNRPVNIWRPWTQAGR